MESKEERLLRAIFNTAGDEEDENDNYPDTVLEKVGYAEYVLTKSIEYSGRAIHLLSRLHRLLMVGEKDGVQTLPDIITNNELRMALEPLLQLENDIKDIMPMLMEIYRVTKTSKKENNAPEPDKE